MFLKLKMLIKKRLNMYRWVIKWKKKNYAEYVGFTYI